MKIFVVEVGYDYGGRSWSQVYLVFADDKDKVIEKIKETTDNEFRAMREIKEGETSLLYELDPDGTVW